MKLFKVGAASVNQTPLDWEGNQRRILTSIEKAATQNVDLLLLPEMCITGYGCEDAFLSPNTLDRAWAMLQDIVIRQRTSAGGMREDPVCVVGLPVRYRNAVFNCAAVIAQGKIQGIVPKQNLAGDGLHYEHRWFRPWENGCQDVLADRDIPFGDCHFSVDGVQFGFEICEDAWVAERPGARLARNGVDIILNPSASHFAFGKFQVRKQFVIEGSRAFNCTYVYANLLGNEAGRAIYDGGNLIASGGELVTQGRRFSYQEVELSTAVVDVEKTRTKQAWTASFRPEMDEGHENLIRIKASRPAHTDDINPPIKVEPWENDLYLKEQEFTRATALGLFDYLRKSRSRGFVVSLSGGADSAAVACLVRFMVELAYADLDLEFFNGPLKYLGLEWDTAGSGVGISEFITRQLLTCVYQGTRNSYDADGNSKTLDAATTLAEGIGAKFHKFDVDPVVQAYEGIVAKALGRQLTWGQDDIARQNIQARTRAPGVWMLTNILGALLLTTSNRSEAAVGYATMDGDTCGGLAPVAGIDKNFLRQWLRWAERYGLWPDRGRSMALPSLAAVNGLCPTAELRPQSDLQTDEDDLMPYVVLDAIEREAIRDKRGPGAVFDVIKARGLGQSDQQVLGWVEKFFTLWSRNQWKRERYAPSFHVDDENLDPKTWCRWPILSAGFRVELAELRTRVQATTSQQGATK